MLGGCSALEVQYHRIKHPVSAATTTPQPKYPVTFQTVLLHAYAIAQSQAQIQSGHFLGSGGYQALALALTRALPGPQVLVIKTAGLLPTQVKIPTIYVIADQTYGSEIGLAAQEPQGKLLKLRGNASRVQSVSR